LRYLFEDCALDTDRRELRRGTALLSLEPQVFDLLVYLIGNRKRVVSKDDLLTSIWHGRIVSESALSTRINLARSAIGDNGREQRLIKTLPRKGLRFVGIVREDHEPADLVPEQPGAKALQAGAGCGQSNRPWMAPRNRDEATSPTPQGDTSADHVPKHAAEKSGPDVLAGERKHVTVLCADIKESLELVAERNPEEALKILDAVLTLMTQAVHRYEGTVNLVTGDGIMAMFGVPLTHEDHAVRACYAALQIREAVKRYAQGLQHAPGVSILVRAGLNSGEVVTRPIASDLHTEYRAMGQATRLAARLGQIAPPGTLLVSADTLRLAEGHVQVKALDPANTAGLEPVYELVGEGPAQTRFQALTARGLTSFVGRSSEMEQLERVQARVQQRHGQVITIIGEPGLGKSRLLHEYVRSRRTSHWLVLETASLSYRTATSYLPVIELLKTYFKIADSDDVREMRDKVVGRLLNLDRALAPDLCPLLALLDIPVEEPSWQALDATQRRQRTLDALKRLFLRETLQQPVILAFEDLHWTDTETLAFLEILIDVLASVPLLLILTYRPEYEHHWGGKSYYTQVRLNALSPETTEEFLRNLVGDDASLIRLKELLPKHGNPFFLEESIRSLVEMNLLEGKRGGYRLVGPLQDLRIPPTVQAILAARIDRLPARDKRLLQAASVVDKDVPYAILQAIAGLGEEELRRGLAGLREAEFLYEARLFPDLEYTFKHALTHEVAYGSLLAEQRRALHRQIMDVIERLYPDRLTEYIERLAHHAVHGELREKAVQYLRQAGLKAAARSALPDARVWFEQALGVLEALPESPSTLDQAFEIRLELRPVLFQLGEVRESLERLREAEALAERLDDDRRRGQVCALMTNGHSLLGELAEAVVTGTRALEIAKRLGDLRLRIPATTYVEQAYYFRGDYLRVVELATDNLAALPADCVHEYFGMAAPPSVYDRSFLVRSLAELGRFTEAAKYEAEAMRLAEPTHHGFTLGRAYFAASTLHLLRGDWTKARSSIVQWIAAARAGNVVIHVPWAVAASAWASAQLGGASEALDRLQEAEHLLKRHAAKGIVAQHGWAYHALGRTSLMLGRLEEAQRLGDRAVECLPSQPGSAAHALHLLGDVASHPDRFDLESGEAHYRQALAIAEPRGMRPLVAHCHLGLGKLYRRTDRHDQASENLRTAKTMFWEMDMPFWLKMARAEIEAHS
jgi:class 3 adenylate cyclase/DNA-binding winged helix-turn-helix (wHTH) protein/tetratricopeptide (TPR) repeat protein